MKIRQPLSLYLHIPFCISKCRYCDFLSAPSTDKERAAYTDLLCREIRQQAMRFTEKVRVDTVFFGGGTPSLLTPDEFGRIMDALWESFSIDSGAEISMEANPGTLTWENAVRFRQEGVNRLSLGVQSFDDKTLRFLGRIHTADEAREAFLLARSAGYRNISIDLMSALPGQTKEAFRRDLEAAADLSPEHLSVYSLIPEEGTPLGDAYLAAEGTGEPPAGFPALPDEDTDRAIYHFTKAYLEERGYERYEISNYAREGHVCRHNLGYWTDHDYLGFGRGAASRLFDLRLKNPEDPQEYDRYVRFLEREPGAPAYEAREVEKTPLTEAEQMEEYMFLGLRYIDGVSEAAFETRFQRQMQEVYGDVIRRHVGEGLLARKDGRIALTDCGLDVANRVMADFLLSVS